MADFKKLFGKRTYNDPRIERYENILQQSGEPNADLHFKLGRLYQYEKETIEAVKHYEAAARWYLKAKDYLAASATYKILSILNPEDHEAAAQLANIEFETAIALTEQAFKKFLHERGEAAPLKLEPSKSEKIDADAETTTLPKNRRKRGQENLQDVKANALFQEKRKRLVDMIAGTADDDDRQFQKSRQEFLDLLDDDSSALQAPGERISTAETPPQAPQFLIDLTEPDAPSIQANEPTSSTEIMLNVLSNSPLFAALSDSEKAAIIRRSAAHSYDEDATIMRYPSEQQELFVVVSGEAYLIKERDGCGVRSEVIQVNPGECWGEHTLFAQMNACAFSVMASNGTAVLEISQDIVHELTLKYQRFFKQLKELCERRWCPSALSLFPLFGELSEAEQQQLLPLFSEVAISGGEVIIREGDDGQSMFLIQSGDVEVFTTLVEEGDVQIVQSGQSHLFLAKLRAGDCFGEGAFFTNEPRNATVQALTETKLLKLAGEQLTQLFQHYPNIARKLRQYHEKRVRETMKILRHAL